jgi:hypothetical protein
MRRADFTAVSEELTSPYPPSAAGRFAAADRSYVVLSVVLGVVMLFQQLNQQWSRDVFVHIAAIREFSEHGLAAKNPFTGDNSPDAYLTPFHFIGGMLQTATHWDVTAVLTVLGMTNLVLFVVALRMFVRTVTLRPWAPTFALAFTLVAWGIGPWRWAGYLNLNSIGFGLPYPAVFSTAVGLVAIVALVRFLRGGRAWYVAAMILLGALALLTHPLTTVWLAMIALSFVLAAAKEAAPLRLLVVASCIVATCLIALAWPPYSLRDVLAHSGGWESANQSLYHLFFLRTFLALPGVLALWLRARKQRFDPLVTAAVLISAIYVIGAASDSGLLGRTMPGLLLVLHVAFADVAAILVDRRSVTTSGIRRIGLITGVVVLSLGTIGVAGGLMHSAPRAILPPSLQDDERLASVVAPWKPLARVLDHESVVVTPDDLSDRVAAFGGYVIVLRGSPSLSSTELAQRRFARDIILADSTSEPARRLRRAFGITHIVVPIASSRDLDAGPVVLRTNRYVAIDVRSTSGN